MFFFIIKIYIFEKPQPTDMYNFVHLKSQRTITCSKRLLNLKQKLLLVEITNFEQ